MIPMMVDVLAATGTKEPREQLYEHVEEFVMRLNGRQTIYQMIRLSEEVAKRGAAPLEPLEYKRRYHDLLWDQVGQRIEAVRSGAAPAELMTVPGAESLLKKLCQRGLRLYLASGTDLAYVRDELQVLGLDPYFGSRVYGALEDYKKFSKAMIIEQIIRDTGVAGDRLMGMGDGFVEIEEIKKVGGLAVGVASNEETRVGINDWKRARLIRAGADIIIGDYGEQDRLLELIGLA
jgi:phosphoglycolate phosphatase-like HAD superfamily hydrolase